ncbi:MAG TPA: DUF2892 domain-containing protein [Bdellovibrionota bacterium]|nr:DUF2892 domain-containing protein [Bdellovibrionota bacterium]
MTCNVGPKERYGRLAFGIAAGTAAVLISGPGWLRGLLGVFATSGIFTGVTKYCPANQLIGIQNCEGGRMLKRVV